MPTYDYFCKKCQNTFEYFQSMSDSALEKCPKCNNKVRRLISGGSGLIFKGSGFYLTDYAQKKENLMNFVWRSKYLMRKEEILYSLDKDI